MNVLRDVRTRLLLVVVAAIAAALIVATFGFNFILARSTSTNVKSLLTQRAVSERGLIGISNGQMKLTQVANDPAGDSRIWIFTAQGQTIEAPRARATTTAAARSLMVGRSRFFTVEDADERLFSLPIVDHGTRYGTIVAGVSLAPYEETGRSALLASLGFAAVVLLIAGAAAAWLLRSVLRPVETMTTQAEAWSEQDLDRRFGLGEPHDELTRLAFTLDRLLDRISASLRHERRFSAEVSHELRTPLAKLTAEAEIALRRRREPDEYQRAITEILSSAQQIARIVDTLLAAAQQEAGPRGVADASSVALAAAHAVKPLADKRGIEVTVLDQVVLQLGVDRDLAERIVHPVLDNACRYGRSQVSLRMRRDDGLVVFTVEDDGPGVPPGTEDEIFEPATRGEAGRNAGPSAGLGLALARRLARSVSGDVLAAPSAAGGLFTIRLPAA